MSVSADTPGFSPCPPQEPAATGRNAVEPEALNRLQEAFRTFNDASNRFSEHFARLEKRVQDLNLELEEANGSLRENLREKEKVQAYLSTLLESLPVGVVGVDPTACVISCNRRAAEILEQSAGDVQGIMIGDVLGGAHCKTILEAAAREGFAAQKEFESEYQRASDGRRRTLRFQLVPTHRREKGEAAGVLLIEDVTDIRRLEHQASRNNRLTAMGEIAMNVAHEIRNPLGSIQLFATMLQRDLADDPTNGPLAAHICTGVQCIDHIVSNILQFSRPQRLARSLVSLNSLIDETLVFTQHALRLKNIRIERDYAKPDPYIWVDGELIKQVFLNLFLNAVQATPEAGRIGVRTLPNCQTVETQVWDTGCGLGPEIIGRIFDPFFTTRRKGTGLGLTIVHNVVSAHQGSIEADNRPEGGAVFTIVLPKRGGPDSDEATAHGAPRNAEETELCQRES